MITTAPAKQSRNALCQCGSGEKYKKCCGAASRVPPITAQALHAQGQHLLQAGQTLPAMAMFLRAVQLDATFFEAHHALGAALLQSGRLADASAILRQAVALRPGSVAAQFDLATAYDRQNLHDAAVDAYGKVAALAPERGDVQLRLGQLHAMYSRMAPAADCLERAADLSSDKVAARLYRADAGLLRGDHAGAEQWARAAVATAPDSDAARAALAGLLYNQGRFAEAAELFEEALRLNPVSAKSWDGLVHCRQFGAGDSAVADRMAAVLQRQDLDDDTHMAIHFALGKVFDDCGDYARAMEQFDAANRLRARGLVFDRAGLAAMVDRTIALFTPAFMARNVALGVADETPLFIVGMYRSGTTLAEQILSSHPDIAAGGELTVWSGTDIEPDAGGAFDAARTGDAVAKYLGALRGIGGGAARVTDKLPANFFRLGAIHTLLPRARIVHCVRDPVDTCFSIYATLFDTRLPFAARFDDLVFYYGQYRRIMAHWRRVLPPDVLLDVDYENLIADRAVETRRLVAFAGVDWDDRCLQPERNDRAIGTASAWQARQPVYATSLARWRRYEKWLGELMQLK
jgi:tetratricopeptide (TPR) repeat protein